MNGVGEAIVYLFAIFGAFCALLILSSIAYIAHDTRGLVRRLVAGLLPATNARASKASIGYTAPPRGDEPPKGSDE